MALHVLGADVQNADGRLRNPVHGGHEGLAHDGELDQLGRIALDIGTDVEHGRIALRGGPAGDDGRTLKARRGHAQQQFGNGHKSAGVARGDHGSGLARLDRLNGIPEA